MVSDKIETIQIRIVPRNGDNYSKPWSYEISWTEFKGVKNTTVHKHFTIPEDAATGIYDFLIIMTEENGTITEEKRTIKLILPAALPVDPLFSISLLRGKKFLYSGDKFLDENDRLLKKEIH